MAFCLERVYLEVDKCAAELTAARPLGKEVRQEMVGDYGNTRHQDRAREGMD
jgi:hypothetical protein